MEDRLSRLADEVLHLILANLPMKSQVETSLLSRRWRHLWSLNHVLHLVEWTPDDQTDESDNLEQQKYFLLQMIRRWRASNLHILELQANIGLHLDLPVIKEWIDLAASNSLQHLSLEYEYDNLEPPFTQYMQKGLSFLKFLHLKRVPLTDGPPLAQYMQRGLPSLIVLHLSWVTLGDGDLDILLSMCSQLESMKLDGCLGVDHMVVSSGTLKTLEVNTKNHHQSLQSLVVALAPKLVNLVSTSECFDRPKLCIENKVPNLVGVSLHNPLPNLWPYHLLPAVPSLSHIHVLSVDIYFLEAMSLEKKVFGDLRELHLNCTWLTDHLLDALHIFLRRRPSIEKLCLQLEDRNIQYEHSEEEYYEYVGRVYESNRRNPCFKNLTRCKSMSQLRIAKVIGFIGTRNEMRLVRFLLRSATNLESLRLFCSSNFPKNLIKQLSWCRRASSNALIRVAGCENDIDNLSQQLETTPLNDKCWQAAEDYQDVSNCSWHSVNSVQQDVKVKSFYVHRSKSNQTREGNRGRRRKK